MPFKEAFLPRDLVLPYEGREYVVRPPTKETGAKLAAVNAAGVATYMSMADDCPTCGRSGTVTELPAETQALLEGMKDEDVSDLALGADVAAQMRADGVPEAHVDTMAVYALYYWTLGEAVADQIMDAVSGDGPGKAPEPSASSTSKRGRRTGSASPTSPASSPATGESPTTSAPDEDDPTAQADESDGVMF